MFILKQLSFDSCDWVEDAILVSTSKQLLKDHYKLHGPCSAPLIDFTQDESLQSYCNKRNESENRVGHRKLSTFCFDYYWAIGTIEMLQEAGEGIN